MFLGCSNSIGGIDLLYYITSAGQEKEGYFVICACIGCGSCAAACPQQCIEISAVPYVIRQENCLHCWNCLTACPAGAEEKR
ncbi:MAG: 4Fe-4S dicluster domain-containing protein [Mailhella sp.]|nr:4Fe-4S dicluster domain-containing protein [Mailhella sp.]